MQLLILKPSFSVLDINQLYNFHMDFRNFLQEKINYLAANMKRNAVLLEENGEKLFEINLSYDRLSGEYISKEEELQQEDVQLVNSTLKLNEDSLSEAIKINDEDLSPLWDHLSCMYKLSFNIDHQNISDETVLRISQLYEDKRCGLTKLNFSNNERISQMGAVKLAEALRDNQSIQEILFHNIKLGKNGANRIAELLTCSGIRNLDLGVIGNESLKYLSRMLENAHNLQSISFGEDEDDPWKDGKESFKQTIRRNENSKQILSVNLYPADINQHWELVNELNILCRKRRNLKLIERENEFKMASLNPDHSKYYDPQNHGINAYKFSVKSYLTNVFGSDLEEALYFIEKERRNSLREESIFQITREPINKIIMEDICTADGSILVLAKYLLGKAKEKKQQVIEQV